MLIKIFPENPNLKEINKVVDILLDGGLVVYPTDTVYAIGCDALNVRAVEKICKLKGINPLKSNLSIIVSNISEVSTYARISNKAFKLMKRLLPGPYTFILPTSSELPKIYKNRKEVGIRIPDNSIILTLEKTLGNPILTTSINLDVDDFADATNPELIHEYYENIASVVIDGGIGGTEVSAIVNCTTDNFVVERKGKGDFFSLD